MTKFVDYDPHTGVTETFYKDHSTNKIKINQAKDLGPLLKLNTIDRNASSKTFGKETFHKVASVDAIIIDIWRQELKAKGYDNYDPLAKENKAWLIAKLNSRDFKYLKTKDVTI